MDYTSTSRIRRRMKTKLTRFKDRLQDEMSRSLNDLTSIDEHHTNNFKKLIVKELTASTLSLSCIVGKEFQSLSTKKVRKTIEITSSDDESEDVSEKHVKYKVLLDDPEDTTLMERIGMKIREKTDQYFQKNSKVQDINKRFKSQIWSSVVTIVLVEGKKLLACDPETETSDPYVKFRLGNEKYKSRVIWRTLNPRWLEQLDLHLYDDGDQELEITVWDKDRAWDDFMGRCVINLASLEREKTHNIWQEIEDGAGSLHLLLTISGTTASETISDLTTYEENCIEKRAIEDRYVWHQTFHNMKDVGHLTVKVFKASGLAAADLGGKSDPFCVVELGNTRLQTQTEYKTLAPSWNKIFSFNVRDINNILEITVFDEDRDHKVEFLGKVAIPLLRIRNGEKRWFALKDKKLRSRAKGSNPQILLEMSIVWNPVRACIRTLNPKEEKYMQTEVKFKRQVFVKNVLRLKVFIIYFYELGKLLQNSFEWESKLQSFGALVVWLIICYYFESWMVPVAALLIFLKQYIIRTLAGPAPMPWDETAESDLDDDENEEEKEKEEKKSLKERLQAIQEVTQGVQNAIGKVASLLESIKKSENWFGSWLNAAKNKSTEVLEFVKKDLEEFSSAVKNEASCVVSSTGAVLEKTLKLDSPDSTASNMKRSFSSFLGQMNNVLNPSPDDSDTEIFIVENSETVKLTKLQKAIYDLQKDPNTFLCDPEQALNKQFQCWLEIIDDQLSDDRIAKHVNSSEVLKHQYAKLVPDIVEHQLFWKRYLFKKALLEDDIARKEALEKREQKEKVITEESLKWDQEEFGNDIELTEEEQIKLLEQYENEKKNEKSSPKRSKVPIGEKVIFKQDASKEESIPTKLQGVRNENKSDSKLVKNDSTVNLDVPSSSSSSTDGDWEKISDIEK